MTAPGAFLELTSSGVLLEMTAPGALLELTAPGVLLEMMVSYAFLAVMELKRSLGMTECKGFEQCICRGTIVSLMRKCSPDTGVWNIKGLHAGIPVVRIP
jgi:hypothetical protein